MKTAATQMPIDLACKPPLSIFKKHLVISHLAQASGQWKFQKNSNYSSLIQEKAPYPAPEALIDFFDPLLVNIIVSLGPSFIAPKIIRLINKPCLHSTCANSHLSAVPADPSAEPQQQ